MKSLPSFMGTGDFYDRAASLLSESLGGAHEISERCLIVIIG